MEVRFANSAAEAKQMDTEQLRAAFLIERLMLDDTIQLTYTHYDRVIIGGARPVTKKLSLENETELRAGYFLERRELGIINVGAPGMVSVDDTIYTLDKLDCLYVGKGAKNIIFESKNASEPAAYYFLSTPAHAVYPVQFLSRENAESVSMGSQQTSNERIIYRYIHEKGLKSCQLLMGLTVLNKGSVWNTMPAHTHSRRMEVYFYFDVPQDQAIFHFMGEPAETRHILLANCDAVVSPPWSIHAGCGTANYSFIWGMAGENYSYSDMDIVTINEIK